jgi:hypothetical protein
MKIDIIQLKIQIENSITQVYKLKIFMDCIINTLGEVGDYELIHNIKKKAEKAERNLEKSIQFILQNPIKFIPKTSREIQLKYQKKLKRTQRTQSILQYYLKSSLLSHGISIPPMPQYLTSKAIVENVQRRFLAKQMPGVESFNYKKNGITNYYIITSLLSNGTSIKIKFRNDKIDSYKLKLLSWSFNMSQVLRILENYCEHHFPMKFMDLCRCLGSLGEYADAYKQVFTKKCTICECHLSLKSGIPMIPVLLIDDHFYHIECYYDISY